MKYGVVTGSILLLSASVALCSCSTTSIKEGVQGAADNVTGAVESVEDMADNFGKAYTLFMDQLNKPAENLNTGISYWIELKRGDKQSRVSSKSEFHSGDKIRFHVKPNINAYGYVVLLQGSNGDQAVLFPSAALPQQKLTAGKEMILPATDDESAWLKFDNNPGMEVLRIVISRKKIKADEFSGNEVDGVTVGSGDKADEIPDDSSVGMVDDEAQSSSNRNLTVVSSKKHAARKGETTVINGDPKRPLIVDIALKHV